MAYANGRIARTITSADGRQTVDIVARADGLYQFYLRRLEQQLSRETR